MDKNSLNVFWLFRFECWDGGGLYFLYNKIILETIEKAVFRLIKKVLSIITNLVLMGSTY